MFRPYYGKCVDCPAGTKSYIIVKAGRCKAHNDLFKQNNKSSIKLKLPKPPTQIYPLFRFKPKKSSGEKPLFEYIWDTRLHKCEVCGRPIIRKKDGVGMFSHVLSKGASPQLKLDEDFILLMGDGFYPNCNCHQKWEHRTDEMRNIEMWKPIYLILDSAKIKSHQNIKNKPLYENGNS